MREDHANFPGATHGGLIACALDEVMGQTVFVETGALAVSLEAHVEWLASTPIQQNLTIKSQILHKFGRYFLVGCELYCGRKQCAKSRGLYFQPSAQMMAKMLRLKEIPLEAQAWFK
jgi:acyl-coenzyme A thioesterase PaaI-like protein